MEEGYESVLFIGRECFVYRLPPRTSTAGYKAAEWGDMEAFLWKGRVRVIETITSSTESTCTIRLEDSDTGELFAQCPYDVEGTACEPVLDSQRYFVLRVVDATSGQKAYLGMGFLERSDSFDYNVAIQDWQKRQRAMARAASDPDPSAASAVPSAPKVDYSLKEGQTISINIGRKGAGSRKKPSEQGDLFGSSSAAAAGGAGGIPFLPPPPPPRGR